MCCNLKKHIFFLILQTQKLHKSFLVEKKQNVKILLFIDVFQLEIDHSKLVTLLTTYIMFVK